MSEEGQRFCDERNPDSLRCDLRRGHGGAWHEETEVGRWRHDDPETQWFVGFGKQTRRRIYRADAPAVSTPPPPSSPD